MNFILSLTISALFSVVFCKIYLRRKLQLISTEKNLIKCIEALTNEKNELKNNNDSLLLEIEQNEDKLLNVQLELSTQSERLNKANEEFSKSLEIMKKNLLRSYENSIKEHQEDIEKSISAIMKKYSSEISSADTTLKQQKASISAYIEEQKRKEEMLKKKDYYRIVLTDNEIKDINKLLSLSNDLTQPDILLKLIYKTYFEKKMNDLLARVVGVNSEVSGIYKITNLELDKSYIGQCVSFKDRWRTHLKRGLGIDTPSTNKFYQAMKEYKPWNFTFEVLEFCEKADLNKKESYWIDFYQTNTWGYNATKGVDKQ